MAITSDVLNEIFTATQNDMQQIISAAKLEFYNPEIERETVSMWLSLPLVFREAITAKNPKLAKELDNKAEQFRKGDKDYGLRL